MSFLVSYITNSRSLPEIWHPRDFTRFRSRKSYRQYQYCSVYTRSHLISISHGIMLLRASFTFINHDIILLYFTNLQIYFELFTMQRLFPTVNSWYPYIYILVYVRPLSNKWNAEISRQNSYKVHVHNAYRL